MLSPTRGETPLKRASWSGARRGGTLGPARVNGWGAWRSAWSFYGPHKKNLTGGTYATGRGTRPRTRVAWFSPPGPWTKSLSITCKGPSIFFQNNLPKEKCLWVFICLNSISKFIWLFPLAGLDACLQFVIPLAHFVARSLLVVFFSTIETKPLVVQLPFPWRDWHSWQPPWDCIWFNYIWTLRWVCQGKHGGCQVMGQHLCTVQLLTLWLHPAL